MSYSKIEYPASFDVLKPELRKKALEIANNLLEEGLSRSLAEEIAKANSLEMARCFLSSANAHITECTLHVIPHPDGWAIVSQDVSKFYAVYFSKNEAITYARSYAKCVKFKLFIHSELGVIEDSENFIVNKPVTLSSNRLPVAKREMVR